MKQTKTFYNLKFMFLSRWGHVTYCQLTRLTEILKIIVVFSINNMITSQNFKFKTANVHNAIKKCI